MRPGVYMTHAALKKLWAGEMDPNSVMIETIMAIARFLEVDLDDFGPVVARRRRQVFELAGQGLELAAAGSGMVAPDSAGVVQRQNISFPS